MGLLLSVGCSSDVGELSGASMWHVAEGFGAARMDAAEIDEEVMNEEGMDAAGMDAAEMNAAGMDAVGMDVSSMAKVDVDSTVLVSYTTES